MVAYVLQLSISGLAQGSLYALAALGLVVIYNASNVVNFAQGAMGMATTYVTYVMLTNAHAPFAIAFIVAIGAAFVLGAAVQAFLLRRLGSAPVLAQIVLTLGLFMFIEGIIGLIFGYSPLSIAMPFTIAPFVVGPIVFRPQDIVELSVLFILAIALILLFRTTKIGLAMRAMTQNAYAAKLMGIPTSRLLALSWAIGTVLGGIAAILAAPTTSVTPNMMDTIIVYAFVAAVLGGVGSAIGWVVGGLVLGIVVNLIDAFVAPELAMTIVFGLLLIVLYVKPDGIFGRRGVEKV